MAPRIKSGQLCTVQPMNPEDLCAGEIVLCTVHDAEYLHILKAIQGPRSQIGNNRGGINGWVGAGAIFGRLVKVKNE